jgi:2-phosphoglycerate kinase
MLSSIPVSRLLIIFLNLEGIFLSHALTNGIKTRSFVFSTKAGDGDKPKLVLIGGSPGTGKSTFGMSVALDQGILKCISTDTVRAVMRSFIPADISPALHRSSYAPASEDDDDPVRSWRETCTVLEASVQELVTDSISRGQGLVLEGVSIAPSKKLIKIWEEAGGVAIGCLLTVCKEETHKSLLQKRGVLAGIESTQNAKDQKKIQMFDRILKIQNEMIRLAEESSWILIEQKMEPDPLEIIANKLVTDDECDIPDNFLKANLRNENAVHAPEPKPERVAPSS